MPTFFRRLILWTVICGISAAPSFVIASGEYDRAAMLVGVCLFIAAYTWTTCTATFERIRRRPFVRRTLYIGYGFRLLLSMIFPLGLGSMSGPSPIALLLWADIWPGLLSVQIVRAIGLESPGFVPTLATTIVQGTLLNGVIFVLMLVVYWFQRLFMKPPPEQAPRGFEVVLPAATGPGVP